MRCEFSKLASYSSIIGATSSACRKEKKAKWSPERENSSSQSSLSLSIHVFPSLSKVLPVRTEYESSEGVRMSINAALAVYTYKIVNTIQRGTARLQCLKGSKGEGNAQEEMARMLVHCGHARCLAKQTSALGGSHFEGM
jgi:hypothetical protein